MAFSKVLNRQHSLGNADSRLDFNRLVAFYILGFALIYTLIPFVFYQSILPDSAQNLAWGRTWEWSYNRHPPLGTWFIKLMSLLIGNTELATFSASACCLSVSLLFIYKLSKNYLSKQDAFVACILSSFSVFYLMYYALEFNQNTIMLAFWVMLAYCFDSCLKENRLRDWLILGGLAAAAMLAKYESLIILFLAFVYLCFHFKKQYITNVLIAFTLALVLLIPHFLSVVDKGFLPWVFLQERVGDGQSHGFLYKHLYYPLKGLIEQFCHISPALVVLAILVKYKRFWVSKNSNEILQTSMPDGAYLVYLGFSPLLFVLALSLLMGIRLRSEWGYPLFSFTLPALMYYFRLKTKPSILPTLLIIALSLHVGNLLVHKAVHYFSHKDARSNFPSYHLAQIANSYWQQFTDKPIKYVGGEENVDYYLSTYLPSKPLLFEAYSFATSHWIKPDDLKKGGMLLAVAGCDPDKINPLKEEYHVHASRCVDVPLNNKYRLQFKQLTLMVVLPIG